MLERFNFFVRMFLPNIVISLVFLPLLWSLYYFFSEYSIVMLLIGVVAGVGFTFGSFVGFQWSVNWANQNLRKEGLK